MLTGQITDAEIYYKPSKSLLKYIRSLKCDEDEMPISIANICKNRNKDDDDKKSKSLEYERDSVLETSDIEYLNSLNLSDAEDIVSSVPPKITACKKNEKLLNFDDLLWISKHIEQENEKSEDDESKVYFHQLFQGTDIILPKNEEIPRNEELEARCVKLRHQQDNRQYKAMTKNVDNARQSFPEDTISFQMKQINQQLIAVFQFIVSVLTGFVFGFVGIELMIGQLDFGFRLLLGIICALIIALAELYFLAKKLNENVEEVYNPTAITSNHLNSKVKRE